MSEEINQLQPQEIWKNFAAINAIPRPSKKEEKIVEFMVNFGKNLGLDTSKDEVGNVRILKPATMGMENRKIVCLQSHLDMVCQKNNDTQFDFDTQGIQMYVEDGFVKAKGTTLGADNGLGVAAIMAVLESEDIPHPPIEALFTIDEETGMTGAKNLQPGWLKAEILLNLDTEEDDELDIGCAGGVDVTGTRTYEIHNTPEGYETYKLKIKGLQGGHSGGDIHKGFGNANKLLGKFLYELRDNIVLHKVEGGGLRNAIPREAYAYFSTNKATASLKRYEEVENDILKEFKDVEVDLQIDLSTAEYIDKSMSQRDTAHYALMLNDLFNGAYLWSKDIPNLVEASNNVARIEVIEGNAVIKCLTRSSREESKEKLANELKEDMERAGFSVEFSGDYPGWAPNPNSEILSIMKRVYVHLFGEKPKVLAIHAGLECGIIGNVYPQMEMISFGPNIYGAHSPDERAEIKSVSKFWKLLKSTLEHIPEQ